MACLPFIKYVIEPSNYSVADRKTPSGHMFKGCIQQVLLRD